MMANIFQTEKKSKYANFMNLCHQSSQITKRDYPRNQSLAERSLFNQL